jgi:hypothetical protein
MHYAIEHPKKKNFTMTRAEDTSDHRSDKERFYDDVLAPALKDIASKCIEQGMSFVASVEYEPGERGSTRVIGPNSGLAMVMLGLCDKAGVNIDSSILGLARHTKSNNIDTQGSLVMNYVNHGTPSSPGSTQRKEA